MTEGPIPVEYIDPSVDGFPPCQMVFEVEGEASLPGVGVRTRTVSCGRLASIPWLINGVEDLICSGCDRWLLENPQPWAKKVE